MEVSSKIIEYCQLFKCTVSFGGMTSLISLPCLMSHAAIPAHVRKERGMPEDLLRISVGTEHIDDLINDLK